MRALQHFGAAVPGLAAPERPTKDDARELGGSAGIEAQGTTDNCDSRRESVAGQALCDLRQRAQALAARMPHLGIGPDLAALSLVDLWGAYRFLIRMAEGVQA